MPASVILNSRFRKDVIEHEDDNIAEFKKVTGTFTGIWEDKEILDTSSGFGIYFVEHTSIHVQDHVHGTNFHNYSEDQMDRFRCPKRGVCSYPYGKPAPIHYY